MAAENRNTTMHESGMNAAGQAADCGQAAKPTPPPGYDPNAEFVNVSPERFTQVPKQSHRAGDNRLESLVALGVLTLYLSNKTGWKIPNAETLASQWSESADRIRKAIADMERAGWLVRFNEQAERGRWVTRTFVSSDTTALDPYREYKAALENFRVAQGKPARGKKAPKQIGPTGSALSQVGPDGSFRDPVDRDPVDRDPDVRVPVTGHPKDQETKVGNQEETKEEKRKDQTPPPPSSPQLASATAPDAREEEEEITEEERHLTRAAMLLSSLFDRLGVDEARRPQGARRQKLLELAADRIAGGWGPTALAQAIGDPLVGVDSIFSVMRYRLQQTDVQPPRSAAPEQVRPANARCQVRPTHNPYPAKDCPICKLDAEDKAAADRAEQDEEGPAEADDRPAEATTETKPTGLAAARAIAAASGSGRKIELRRTPRGLEGRDPQIASSQQPVSLGSMLGNMTEVSA